MEVLIVIGIFLLTAVWLTAMIRIVPENKRLVVFLMGRYLHTIGPGVVMVFPFLQQSISVSLEEREYDIPLQRMETRDKQILVARLVIYGQVIEPHLSVIKVNDIDSSVKNIALASLRKIISGYDAHDLSDNRETVITAYQQELNSVFSRWGMEVKRVNVAKLEVDDSDLVGKHGRVVDALSPTGTIEIQGDIWSAISDESVEAGTPVMVTNQDGLQLYVEPLTEKEKFKSKNAH